MSQGETGASVQNSGHLPSKNPDHTVTLPNRGTVSTIGPDLTIIPDHAIIHADKWSKIRLTLVNVGFTSAFGITFTFSTDVETQLLRPFDLAAGKRTTIEVAIKPRVKGKILLEITAQYHDAENHVYRQTILQWLSVVSQSDSPDSPLPLSSSHPIMPKNPPLESPQSSSQSVEAIKTRSSITIERTIYDPLIQDFKISSSRPLVNVRDWIDHHDPSFYWLVICVHNHGNRAIDEWGVELESSSALQVLEAAIEGSDTQINLQTSNPKPWLTMSVLGIPHQRGIVIPRGGSRRVYFRLGSESCGISHSIKGRFIANDIEAEIREKQFQHSCDVATLGVAMQQNPEIAMQYTENALVQRYRNREVVLKYLHTFRLIQEISTCYHTKQFEDIHYKLHILEDTLDKIGASDRLTGLVRQLNALDIGDGMGGSMLELKARRAEMMCRNLVDVWTTEVLQVP